MFVNTHTDMYLVMVAGQILDVEALHPLQLIPPIPPALRQEQAEVDGTMLVGAGEFDVAVGIDRLLLGQVKKVLLDIEGQDRFQHLVQQRLDFVAEAREA